MSIPEFEDGQLPAGEWEADWDEIEQRFAYNFRRREILAGLRHVVEQLATHGVTDIWLDGSFATSKQRPNDVDVVYKIPQGGDDDDWPDVGPSRRRHMKQYHRVDLWRFPSWQPPKGALGSASGAKPITIKEFFESDEDEVPRGLVRLRQNGEGTDDQERETAEHREQEASGPAEVSKRD